MPEAKLDQTVAFYKAKVEEFQKRYESMPSEPYVKIIAAGLKETYSKMPDDEIVGYLMRAEGVRSRIPHQVLADWVRAAAAT